MKQNSIKIAEPMADDIAIDHHWVPQSYLKRWSTDGKTVLTYATLAPHENFPTWRPKSIEYLASRSHLYTTTRNPDRPDDAERWLNTHVEQPALGPLEKATTGGSLSRGDWDRLVLYAMALDQRTPLSYMESVGRWRQELPALMEEVLRESTEELESAAREGRPVRRSGTAGQPSDIPLRVQTRESPESALTELRVEITLGRELWLHKLKHVLTVTGPKVLTLGQQWSIVRPHLSLEWFTSDHPLLRLNYYGPDAETAYGFGGGWGNTGTEIMLPLSPTSLLYAKIGHTSPPEFTFSRAQTLLVQRFFAERAFREIYARREMPRVERFRPRVLDAELYKAEQRAWAQWHTAQSEAERGTSNTAEEFD